MSYISRLAVKGLRRGLVDGSKGWLVVGVSASTIAVLRKLLHEKETTYSLPLHADQGVEIRVVKPKP